VVVTLELSEDGMARLRAEAERRQVSVDAVIEEWAASLPTNDRPAKRRQLSFVAMGSSSSGRRAAEADSMLAEGVMQAPAIATRRECVKYIERSAKPR
jgi:hypothetical protein